MIEKQTKIEKVFFELLRSGLWNQSVKEDLFPLVKPEWKQVIQLAKKQTLLGIVFDGMSRLSRENQPPDSIKLQWIAFVHQIEMQNKHLNRLAVEVSEKFRKSGFRNVILKGQGLAYYYSNPLHRQAGDIDIYLEGGREKVLNYFKSKDIEVEVVYHHIDLSDSEGPVEYHTHCSWFFDSFRNYALQKQMKKWTAKSFDNFLLLDEGKIPVPVDEMNHFYLLLHLFRHLFSEGIGLRQVCDYAIYMDRTFELMDRKVYLDNLNKFGLKSFAEAIFYIMVSYLGYPKDKVPVNIEGTKFGPILFDEIMRAGNFGQYDQRIAEIDHTSNWSKFSKRIKRNMTFFSYFPREVLFTPVFKVWHFGWRKFKGYC